ncbi:hypothetical protein F3Y22_tig00110478pilonHSYRG00008 [Hibiscus syriacus]|uniref:DNA-binding domain-containing protein n=1 Tax=Hibiscus syriacus TaxID=106335 RepID=A0A6A3AGR7_HIBSY|nr:hypothetical protein F3Y22_tig00110478pilonHSYRG00008 [Hibiscus syriacus]
MGNYRFKLSDMIPNAWFYKLKDMGRPRNTHLSKERTQQPPSKSKQQQQPHDLNPRNSYYISRELVPVDGLYPPSTVISSSVSTGCSCRETVWSKADSPPDYPAFSSSLSSSDDSSPLESSDADVKKIDEMPEVELPPIVTKRLSSTT